LIIADRISRTFDKGNVRALNDISFCIKQGEMVGIIGKNGVGKTTLLKLIAGVLAPSDGKIWVFENNPCEAIDANKRKMGYLFASYNALEFCKTLRVGCEMQCASYHVDKADYEKIYEQIGIPLGIDNLMDRPLRQLSVGEMRIAEFFHAILHCPKLLLLDEPTIGVDKESREVMCRAFKLLNETYKTTILMASHDMESLEKTCERIIFLQNGNLYFDGSWVSLKEQSDVYKKAEFISERIPDFEDLPIQFMKYEDRKAELLFSQKQISAESLYNFLHEKEQIREFKVVEPPIETIVCDIMSRYK